MLNTIFLYEILDLLTDKTGSIVRHTGAGKPMGGKPCPQLGYGKH